MSVFTQQLNPMTGRLEWGVQPQDYDYKQELARSAYADMLHDEERNKKYYEGLRRAVAQIKNRGDEVRVLDIGTGTGLLSMMAVKCGAHKVTACEAFPPMAECARKGLAQNGFADRVTLISKRSTELEVGPGKDMEQKANLLVAELFDTELIGEGAIETYRHARDFLLTSDALLVPSAGTVYAQVVSSKMLQRWNKISPIVKDIKGKEQVLLSIPNTVSECGGTAGVHDIQLSQMSSRYISPISQPIPVLRFDWSGRSENLPLQRTTHTEFKAVNDGECDVVLMWWDIQMDQCGDVMLSCAPYWAHPDLLTDVDGVYKGSSEDIPWRDHWMQAVYYLPKTYYVDKDSTINLITSHDEYSLWFNIKTNDRDDISPQRHVCECGVHIANSRTRIGQLNDPRRIRTYTRVLERVITPHSVCLALGDGCLMGIVAARMGARHVYMREGSDANRRVTQEFIKENNVERNVTVLPHDVNETTLEKLVAPVDIVLSEPYFSTSLLPWHSLYYWYLRNSCQHLLANNAIQMPSSASIYALPVQYKDLWKIRAPLNECCGFKMDVFDKLIDAACEEADEKVEPQPLWEYPASAKSTPVRMLTLDLTTPIPELPVCESGTIALKTPGLVNGIALWVDWRLTDNELDVISTGPVKSVVVDENVEWDMYSRQGVYLFRSPHTVTSKEQSTLQYTVTFQPNDGTINFNFDIETDGKVKELN